MAAKPNGTESLQVEEKSHSSLMGSRSDIVYPPLALIVYRTMVIIVKKLLCALNFVMFALFSQQVLAEPFSWQPDTLFSELETQFNEARRLPPGQGENTFHALADEGNRHLSAIRGSGDHMPMEALAGLESIQFHMAAIAAAHQGLLKPLQDFISSAHREVITSLRNWKGPQNELRDAIYRVLYGGRAAIEEAWLQNQTAVLPEILPLNDVPSPTPSAMVEGVRIHSGDIVLSRAGAPTSALIARGNDYPGNFSHAPLVHVDPATHVPTVIEALIEKGVVETTLAQYLKDKKRRILVLRLRPEHPALLENPMLPHRAAKTMLAGGRKVFLLGSALPRLPFPRGFALEPQDNDVLSWRAQLVGRHGGHAFHHTGAQRPGV